LFFLLFSFCCCTLPTAILQLDNPQIENNVKEYTGGLGLNEMEGFEEEIGIESVDAELQHVLHGFLIPDYKAAISRFLSRLNDSQEVVSALQAHLSTLTGRIDEAVWSALKTALGKGFDGLKEVLVQVKEALPGNEKLAQMAAMLAVFFPGNEADSLFAFRVAIIKQVITAYWKVERAFHGDVTAESLYANLQEFYPREADLAACFRSHYNLQYKNSVLYWLLDRLLQSPDWGHELVKDGQFEAALRQLTIFSGPKYFSVVHVTRDLLLQGKSISPVILYQQMESKLLQALESGEQESLLQDMILGRYASMDALPKFFHHARQDVRTWALEAYIRRTFQSYALGTVEAITSSICAVATKWKFSPQVISNGNDQQTPLIFLYPSRIL
jgi:hypothetical protein